MNLSPNRIAITGAAGFLGRYLTVHLAESYPVKLLDIQPISADYETIVGSASHMEDAIRLCEGCSDLVIAHMAPNRPEIYATPQIPFEVNVTGTANLFHAASVHKLRRIVLVSSISVVHQHQMNKVYLTRDLPPAPGNLYSLTKTLQEQTAKYYHELTGIPVSVLRPAYICSEDNLCDKYGVQRPSVNWQFIDPRDIAEAVRLSLVCADLKYEVFYLAGHPDADAHVDMAHTRDFLGWKPQYTFEKYPRDPQ